MPASTDTPAAPRIFLLDSGLTRRVGHHAHFGHGLAELCAKENIPLTTLTPNHIEPDLAADLADPRPVFSRNLYQATGNGDMFERAWNDYRAGQRLYSADLDQSGLQPQSTDLFWIPTARPREVAGLAEWLLKHEVRPWVAVGYHLLMRPMTPGSAEGLVHRLAARRLANAVGEDRIFAYATNHRLARRVADAANLDIYLAPLPHFYGAPEGAGDPPALPSGKGPLIACVGVPRADKIHIPLPQIVREALRRRGDLRFVIQVNGAESDSALMALENLQHVKLVEGWLDDGAFIALIRAADMLLLPYHRDRYAENISGPFAFAAALGRPAIVPSGTWMAERIARKQAAGIVYKRDAAVIDALGMAADKLAGLHAQAASLVQRWRVWDAEALLRVIRQWAAGEGTGKLRRVGPQPPSPAAPADSA